MKILVSCLLCLLLAGAALADPQPLGRVEPWIQKHLENGDLESWYESLEEGRDYTHSSPGQMPEVYRKPSERDLRHAVAAYNLNQAVKLLDSRGATATAAGLAGHYQNGHMSIDQLGSTNAITSNVSDAITVDLAAIHPNHSNKTLKEEQAAFAERVRTNPDLDPAAAPTRTLRPSRLTPIDSSTHEGKVALLGLSSTLFHEWIHVGQSRLQRIKSAARQANDHGNDAEMEAWLDTFAILEKWIDAYREAGEKEWELAAVDALLGKFQGLSENEEYFEGAFRESMEKSLVARHRLWSRYRELLVAKPAGTSKIIRGTHSGSPDEEDSSRQFMVPGGASPAGGHF